jgi:hypothetical protein
VGLTIAESFSLTQAPSVALSHAPTLKLVIVFGLNQLNNVATLILLMLFHHLARPTLPTGQFPPEGDIFQEEQSPPDALLNTTEKIKPGEAKFWFWIAIFVIAGMAELALIFSKHAESVLLVFSICYGVAGATATALVVGRLDDQLLGVPLFVIVFLFIYAGIQPSFDFLVVKTPPDNNLLLAAREVIVVIALVSKIVLFATMQWLSTTGRFFYYMVQNYSLYYGVDSHRQNFLQGLNLGLGQMAGNAVKPTAVSTPPADDLPLNPS